MTPAATGGACTAAGICAAGIIAHPPPRARSGRPAGTRFTDDNQI
jgi:hypothetical protein